MTDDIPCPACHGFYGHWRHLCAKHLDHYIRYLGLEPETRR